MHLRKTLVASLIAACFAPATFAAASPIPDQAWFQKNTQALFDALTSGDKTVWDKAFTDDCMVTTEDGDVQDKAELLKTVNPLPPGFTGDIKVKDLTVKDLGTAAVVHYLIDEYEYIFGQQLHTKYLTTDTYRATDAGWKIAASQVTVVHRDLDPVPVDASGFPALVGEYQLDPKGSKHGYHVYLRDGTLFGGRDEKSATKLIPLSPLVFFQSGSIHTMIFVKDAKGAITEVREVHKYNEVREFRLASAGT